MRQVGTRSALRGAVSIVLAVPFGAGLLVGCSLLTDLGDFSNGAPESMADSQGVDSDSGVATEGGSGPMDAGGDAPISVGPYVPKYERVLTITNPGTLATVPAGYTACARGTTSTFLGGTAFTSKVRGDLADVRIFSGATELRRVIDVMRTGMFSMCIRLVRPLGPGMTDSGYTLRYGDPNALPVPPAAASTFDFFEDFDGTALSPRWLKLGNPLVAGGVLTLKMGAQSGITVVSGSDGIAENATLEIHARVTNPSSAGELQDGGGARFYWFGFQHQGDFEAFEPWSLFIARSKSTINAEHKTSTGACATPGCEQAPVTQTTDFRIYKIDRTTSTVRFTYDDGTTFEAAGAVGDLSPMVRTYLLESDLIVDWLRARPFITPEPVLGAGAEVVLP